MDDKTSRFACIVHQTVSTTPLRENYESAMPRRFNNHRRAPFLTRQQDEAVTSGTHEAALQSRKVNDLQMARLKTSHKQHPKGSTFNYTSNVYLSIDIN